jgi:TspO/MBR family
VIGREPADCALPRFPDVLRSEQPARLPPEHHPAIVGDLGTVDRFRRLDRVAVWWLVPLVAWIAFASVLNFEIWRLNG